MSAWWVGETMRIMGSLGRVFSSVMAHEGNKKWATLSSLPSWPFSSDFPLLFPCVFKLSMNQVVQFQVGQDFGFSMKLVRIRLIFQIKTCWSRLLVSFVYLVTPCKTRRSLHEAQILQYHLGQEDERTRTRSSARDQICYL